MEIKSVLNNFYKNLIGYDNKKDLIVISHNDLDGYGPNVFLKFIRKGIFKSIKIINTSVNGAEEVIGDLLNEKNFKNYVVILSDLSISSDMAKSYQNKIDDFDFFCDFKIFDHHKTALNLLEYDFAHIDISKCGSKIFFEWLNFNDLLILSESLIEFVELINQYDTWQWYTTKEKDISKKSKLLSDIFKILEKQNFIEEYYKIIKNNKNIKIPTNHIKLILEEETKKESYIETKLKTAIKTKLWGCSCLIVVNDNYNYKNELGDEILRNEKIDIAVLIYQKSEYLGVILKSNKIDVSEIALKYGGGGHVGISGFNVNFIEAFKNHINILNLIEVADKPKFKITGFELPELKTPEVDNKIILNIFKGIEKYKK